MEKLILKSSEQKYKLLDELENMECTCKYKGNDKNIHEGIIDIIQ